MEPITYRKVKPVPVWKDEFLSASLIWLAIALVWGYLAFSWDQQDWAHNVLRVVILLLSLLAAAGFFRLALPTRNSLTLDGESLTYTRGGSTGIWPWRELPAFTLERGLRGPRIKLSVPRGKGRLQLIEDVWDTPLEEIAAKLNEYRERASGGGRRPS